MEPVKIAMMEEAVRRHGSAIKIPPTCHSIDAAFVDYGPRLGGLCFWYNTADNSTHFVRACDLKAVVA
jgi:hypothetical protein